MEHLIRLMRPLWYFASFCEVALLVRLGYLRIHKRYPALALFLATDVAAGTVGLCSGTSSLAYYWTYFASNTLAGSVLLIRMCTEMFAELYQFHPGLRGLTRLTLRRSTFIGALAALAVAPPVGLLHWGDPHFRCWQFPFFELHRCLSFGVALFVMTMWLKLRALPLDVPRNVKTYAWSACLYFCGCGLVETFVLAMHSPLATVVWSDVLLLASIAFYVLLAVLLERPSEVRLVQRPLVEPEEVAWIGSLSRLFARVDEAQRRGYALTLKRLPFFALLLVGWFHSAWKACARAGCIILGLAQKE